MKKNYKIIPVENNKYQLQVDGELIKLCRTDIVMETDQRELLEQIAEELDPELYRLEDGDIYDQYVPYYFFLSKVLMESMDDSEGLFDEEHYHWLISCDPFFHLTPGSEQAVQRGTTAFAIEKLEKAGGLHTDLPLLMAMNEENMEDYRNNQDYYVEKDTAKIIRSFFTRLSPVRKGLFYQLWSETQWSVWLPLLWLNDQCSDTEFARSTAVLLNLSPEFGLSKDEFEDTLAQYEILLDNCREFLTYFEK